jgi:hypothetical protein
MSSPLIFESCWQEGFALSRHINVHQTKIELVSLLAKYPALFMPYFRLRGKNLRLLVSDETEIVIEGFPRSANTFAVVAFSSAQKRPARVASHLHAPAQVIWAAKRRIPTVVLVRKPADAVLSLVIRDPTTTLASGLRRYVRFYAEVAPYRHRFVVAPFEQVTSNFGQVIDQVNLRFGTAFAAFVHDEESVNRCFSRIDELNRRWGKSGHVSELTVARPVLRRERVREQLRTKLEDERLLPLLTLARDVHRALNNY